MTSVEHYTMKVAGFRVDKVVASMMEDLHMDEVTVKFDRRDEMAMFTRDLGEAVIHLPTRKLIKRRMPELSEDEVTAKIVSQAAEELCHDHQEETCHDNPHPNPKMTPRTTVVSCSIRLMRKHLTKKQLASDYIKNEKLAVLREARRRDDECTGWRDD